MIAAAVVKMDWTKPRHSVGIWVLNDAGVVDRNLNKPTEPKKEVVRNRCLLAFEPSNDRKEFVVGAFPTAIHNSSAVEQHFASALVKPSLLRYEFEVPGCQS